MRVWRPCRPTCESVPPYDSSVRSPRRAGLLVVAALLPLGTIGGHVAGDLVAGQSVGFDGSHSHLRPAAWFTATAAAIALGWLAGTRSGRPARLPLWALAAGQSLFFLGLEGGEYLLGGHRLADLAADPGVRWGLVAQLATAAVLVGVAAAARYSGDRVRAFLAARRRPAPRRATRLATPVVALCTRLPWSPATSRGPPPLVVTSA